MGLFPPAPGGGSEVDYGYKGKGVLIHFLSDRNGHPIAACTTSAKGDERKMVLPLITKTTLNQLKCHVTLTRSMIILEADRGYDAAWLRQKLLNIEIFPMIPYRGKKKVIHQEACREFNLKSERWKVERAIVWIKRKARRIICRWERLFENWESMVTLALIFYWMKILVR
jgi:hypothetical protein